MTPHTFRSNQLLGLGLTMTKVTCSHGFTVNLGDFQSYRVDFGIEDSVREGESVVEATERINKFVESVLESKVAQIVAEHRGQRL